MPRKPKVFISYSWDEDDHKAWVMKLATGLRDSEIDVSIDEWDLHPGQDKGMFMERGIGGSDRVIVVCTEGYYEKAQAEGTGVSFEAMLIRNELMANVDSNKFIPVIRNNPNKMVLKALESKLYIDFRNDNDYQQKFEILVSEIHRMFDKPALGAVPPSEE